MPTKNQQTAADVAALLRARNTLLWVTTREEVRVERAITEAAAGVAYEARFWDCATGLTDAAGQEVDKGRELADPNAVLALIRDSRERVAYVLRDLHKWLDPIVLRALRSLARALQGAPRTEARAIVVLTPSGEIPPELAGCATVIEWPLPERPEIAGILDDVIKALPEGLAVNAITNGERDAVIDSAVGLTAEEAASCYAKSLVTLRRIDPKQVSSEKKRVIAREKVLTWYDPDPRGLDAVGGLDLLKDWLKTRKLALSQKARAYGLPAPRGVLLVGPPGTGKTLVSKAISAAWGVPLLRLDLGALKSKYVGESEGNLRRALQTAETIGNCVLQIEEVEKAMAGSTGPQGDGGVGADALGYLLQWMGEHEGSIFVVMTCNDVKSLPPELTRRGRLDQVFYLDLPTTKERTEVFAASLRLHGRDPDVFALDVLSADTAGFTGAEIASVVTDALFKAFAADRALTTADLRDAAREMVPLSKSASDKLDALRQWVKGRAVPASTPEVVSGQTERVIDF